MLRRDWLLAEPDGVMAAALRFRPSQRSWSEILVRGARNYRHRETAAVQSRLSQTLRYIHCLFQIPNLTPPDTGLHRHRGSGEQTERPHDGVKIPRACVKRRALALQFEKYFKQLPQRLRILKSCDDKSIIAQRRLQGDALERAATRLVFERQGRNHRPRLLKKNSAGSAAIISHDERATVDLEFEISKKPIDAQSNMSAKHGTDRNARKGAIGSKSS